MAQEDGDDERASGEAEFDGLRDAGETDRQRAEDNADDDAEENGHQVRLVQGVVGIAHQLGQMVDILLRSHAHQGISHLDIQIRGGHQFHARADDPRDADAIGTAEMQVLEFLAGQG